MGVIILCISVNGFSQTLGPESQISLITCGPGGELYSSFGHTAIRVRDPEMKMDWVYNYGIFDFNTPNFYTKFTLGKLKYMLGVNRYSSFVNYYRQVNRSVTEQVLNLSLRERRKLFAILDENARPENKYYLYDFRFDNCATKPRDVLEKALGNRLVYHVSNQHKTFRNLLDECLEKDVPWGDFEIDLVLGSVIDRQATPREYMFLPEYLKQAVASASLKTGEEEDPLVLSVNEVFVAKQTPRPAYIQWTSPLTVFSLLFLLIAGLTAWEWKTGKWIKGVDRAFFGVLGLLGSLMLFLWLCTNHSGTAENYNVLWASPAHLLAIFFISKLRFSTLMQAHFAFWGVAAIFCMAGSALLPQQFHAAFYPLMLTVAVRSVWVVVALRNRKNVHINQTVRA